MLDGSTRPALRDLLRRGVSDRRGLDDLLRRVRERQREIRQRGRLDGILEQARALLDTAIGQERAELFPDPSDDARLREAELDTLPDDTSKAIRALADYDWRSPAARETFAKLKDLLRQEVLDSQFRGMKQTLEQPDRGTAGQGHDGGADRHARGRRRWHSQADFDNFAAQYGDLFPDNPANLEELVDSLVRRMQAAQRLLSLTRRAREARRLMSQTLEDAGLAAEWRLADALARRPDLDDGWRSTR